MEGEENKIHKLCTLRSIRTSSPIAKHHIIIDCTNWLLIISDVQNDADQQT